MMISVYTPFVCAALIAVPSWAADPQAPGVPNFHQVNEHVYRGGQPTDQGWSSIAKLGVKTVVDLRRPGEHATAAEKEAVEAAGMRYVNVPMLGVVAPDDEQVAQVLGLFESASAGPVFVHCKRGADRTGTVVACYRMTHDHWSNGQAFAEAKSYGLHWTEIGMKHYIKTYQAPSEFAMSPAAAQPSASVTPALPAAAPGTSLGAN